MAIDLIEKVLPCVDEVFTTTSKKQIITNNDFEWTGAHSIKVYKITTASMNDYDRNGTGTNASRYGQVQNLDAATEEFMLSNDRAFTYAIDKLDTDETGGTMAAVSTLSRQQREVIVPEIDSYIYATMCEEAGTKPKAIELTKENIYSEIVAANTVLDNNEVPETERFLIVSPEIYLLMKQSSEITLDTNVGQDIKLNGVISNLDGLNVIKVSSMRLPENFGFLIGHKVATVAPVKLEDYKMHEDPPGINGVLVEGRICYDAFVLDNKKMALYYQEITA
ncbi:MAG: hypothetical protein IJF37_10505 [Lachnospiraceae bacterium]|nr:hypothetical protein [Lachnospiraceae bacterium]